MKKRFVFALIVVFFISCSDKINLENQEYDKIKLINKESENIEKSTCYFFDIPSYVVDDNEKFTFGNINLSNFSIQDGYPYSKNEISFLVDDYNNDEYKGFAIRLVNDDGNNLLDYLNNKYGKSNNWDLRGNGEAYFWEDKASWFFFFQSNDKNKNDIPYKQSIFIVSQKNTLMQNESKIKTTLLDYFKFIYPQEK